MIPWFMQEWHISDLFNALLARKDINRDILQEWRSSPVFNASVAISKEGYVFCANHQVSYTPTFEMPKINGDKIYGVGIIRGTRVLVYKTDNEWLRWPETISVSVLLTRERKQALLDELLFTVCSM